MISIRIKTDNKTVINELRVEGHAGYKKKGEDIVCAAVSILAQTLINLLEQLKSIKIKLINRTGFIHLVMTEYPDICRQELAGMTAFLVKGYFLLEKNYKQHIKIELNSG